jgi:hypothetical protein
VRTLRRTSSEITMGDERRGELYLAIFARLNGDASPAAPARRRSRRRAASLRVRRRLALRRRSLRMRREVAAARVRATLVLPVHGVRSVRIAAASFIMARRVDARRAARAAGTRTSAAMRTLTTRFAAARASASTGARRRTAAGAGRIVAAVGAAHERIHRARAGVRERAGKALARGRTSVSATASSAMRGLAAAKQTTRALAQHGWTHRTAVVGGATRVASAVHAAGGAILGGTRRVTSALRAAGGTVAAATVRVSRRAVAPLTAALLGAGVVLVAALGQSDHAPAPAPPVFSTEMDVAVSDAAERLLEVSAAVRDPSLSDERVLAIVGEVAGEPHDAATDVLVSITQSGSVVASMAGIRALRGRPCARVTTPLVQRLADRDWQRRAWAAKVLGENGCVAAAPALESRLARERDRRVQRQIADALAALSPRVAG